MSFRTSFGPSPPARILEVPHSPKNCGASGYVENKQTLSHDRRKTGSNRKSFPDIDLERIVGSSAKPAGSPL
jgi:hypothetical protein